MNKRFNYLHREEGAELIEAALIYPLVLLVLAGLLYMGLFILQYMTVGAHAQKVALLAAREVAYPGYISLISEENVNNAAVELALDDYSKAASGKKGDTNGTVITFPVKAYEVHARAYRYWSDDPLRSTFTETNTSHASSQYDACSLLEGIMRDMADKNSILIGKEPANVTITCKNVIVAQYVTVDVKQNLMNSQLLRVLGVEQPYVHVSAVSAANDTDEFIRNTDLVCDALKMIAKKLHINVDDVSKKVNEVKEKLGLN